MNKMRLSCCVATGSCFAVGFLAMMIVGVVEKKRFEPFYRDVECPETSLALPLPLFSLPPNMTPPGALPGNPPFGLYGNIMNTTSSCRNPNQVEIKTKKDDYKGTMYLPELSKWTWGVSENTLASGKINGSYLAVATITLTEDYILPADGAATAHSTSVAHAPLDNFMGVFQAAHLTGYVPLYTKFVARAESCVTIFGMQFCEKKNTVTWCGLLGGNCQTEFDMGGLKIWVPGLCAFTRSICRMDDKGGDRAELEMKALVTAKNLGVSTLDMPCMNHTGLPSTMICPLPSADGINKTMHHRKIHGFVDGPQPDSEDIEAGESMVETSAVLFITAGLFGCFGAIALTALTLRRSRTVATKPEPTTTVLHVQPVLLTSQANVKTDAVHAFA